MNTSILPALILALVFFLPVTTHAATSSANSCGDGNDYLDGGPGTDTAVYPGKRSEYHITKMGKKEFVVRDLVTCRSETDTVVNVEKFKFSDGTKTLKNLKPETDSSREKSSPSVSGPSITQTSVKASSNSFKLSGTAPGAKNVFVAIVYADYTGNTDWHTIYTRGAYVAFTGDTVTKVKKGKWEVEFTGVPSDTYTVLVYNNAGTDQSLLASGTLQVNGTDTLTFKAGAKKPVTLGVGQTLTDKGVDITLISVFLSKGNFGTPVAMFSVTPRGYEESTHAGSVGDFIPESGGISDPEVSRGGIRIQIVEMSNTRNTATIRIEIEAKG